MGKPASQREWQDGEIPVGDGYHIWKKDRRRRMMYLMTSVVKGNNGYATRHSAYWRSKQAASQWAKRNAERVKHGFMVLQCEGEECGGRH